MAGLGSIGLIETGALLKPGAKTGHYGLYEICICIVYIYCSERDIITLTVFLRCLL